MGRSIKLRGLAYGVFIICLAASFLAMEEPAEAAAKVLQVEVSIPLACRKRILCSLQEIHGGGY